MDFNRVITILVENYKYYTVTAEKYFKAGADDMGLAYVHKRSAIYDTMLELADYDHDMVIDWINA